MSRYLKPLGTKSSRFLLCLFLALQSPYAIAGEYPYEEFLPTVEETYNDCKNAIILADKGDMENYYKSDCSIMARTIFSSVILATWVTPSTSKNSTEKERLIAHTQGQLIDDIISKRFCFLKTINQKESQDLQIAKRFVEVIDKYRNNSQFNFSKNGMLSRTPFAMVSILQDGCILDK